MSRKAWRTGLGVVWGLALQAADIGDFTGSTHEAVSAKKAFLAEGAETQVQALAQALSGHSDERVRYWCATTLSELLLVHPHHAGAVREALAAAQKDTSLSVRFAAARGLAALRDASGEAALLSALAEGPVSQQLAALEALKRAGTGAAVPVLIELLDHPDLQVRSRVFWTLARLTGQGFGEKLLMGDTFPNLSEDPDYQAVQKELEELKQQLDTSQPSEEQRKRLEARAGVLRENKQRITARLISDAREAFFRDARECALRWKQWFAAHENEGRALWLRSGLASSSPAVAALAASELAHAQDPAAFETLLAAAREGGKPVPLRLAALRAAGKLLSTERVPEWLTLMETLEATVKAGGNLADPSEVQSDTWQLVSAAAEALRERTGSALAPTAEAWRRWWSQVQDLPAAQAPLGETFFVAREDGQVAWAIRLPKNAGLAPLAETSLQVSRWDAPAKRWETRDCPARAGSPLGEGDFDTGLTLVAVRFDFEAGKSLWEFRTSHEQNRSYLAE